MIKGSKVQPHHKTFKHGMAGSKTYSSWYAMKSRCDREKDQAYTVYGAAGISYDPEWSDFKAFFRDMGIRPDGKTLDRIDNDKGYSKDNCRWATHKEQQLNRRLCVTLSGKTVEQLSNESGVPVGTIRSRMRLGWAESDLCKPSRVYNWTK